MVERRKPLHISRSSNNGEQPQGEDELSWNSLKKVSKEILRDGEGFDALKTPIRSKKVQHARGKKL